MNQGRRFLSNDRTATVTCFCTEADHGALVVDLEPWGGYDDEPCYIQFRGQLRAINLRQRLKQAWRAICGKPVESDFMISSGDMHDLGQWLVEQSKHYQREMPEPGPEDEARMDRLIARFQGDPSK